MKLEKLITLLFILFSLSINAQMYNIRTFGAKGDGVSDDTKYILKALDQIKIDNSKNAVLYIPIGQYLVSKSIDLEQNISVIGEDSNSSIILVNAIDCGAFVIKDNKNPTEYIYRTIKNLTILGPDRSKNPLAWKNEAINNPKSVGLKVYGIRNKIQDCKINGFLWAGIEINSSYYNYIQNSLLINNRIGILITNTSTSAFVNNCEMRTNAIGVIIEDNSYANFINNNMIESNISNFLYPDKSLDDVNSLTTGKGVLIKNAGKNFVQNNYFEQHYVNVLIDNSNNNEISNNFFAIGDLMPGYSNNQVFFKIIGNSYDNSIISNRNMKSKTILDAQKSYIQKDLQKKNIIEKGKSN